MIVQLVPDGRRCIRVLGHGDILLMCLIRDNVLIGRIVPGIHSALPVSESRVFRYESTARILNHVKRQSIKFSVSNFLKLFDENAP